MATLGDVEPTMATSWKRATRVEHSGVSVCGLDDVLAGNNNHQQPMTGSPLDLLHVRLESGDSC